MKLILIGERFPLLDNVSLNTSSITGTSYALPARATQLTYHFSVLPSLDSADFAIIIETSNDNTNWLTASTDTASGTAVTFNSSALFIRATVGGITGGSGKTISVIIVAKAVSIGASTLAGLTDVTLNSPQDGQSLVYDSGSNKWINSAVGGGGGGTPAGPVNSIQFNDSGVFGGTPGITFGGTNLHFDSGIAAEWDNASITANDTGTGWNIITIVGGYSLWLSNEAAASSLILPDLYCQLDGSLTLVNSSNYITSGSIACTLGSSGYGDGSLSFIIQNSSNQQIGAVGVSTDGVSTLYGKDTATNSTHLLTSLGQYPGILWNFFADDGSGLIRAVFPGSLSLLDAVNDNGIFVNGSRIAIFNLTDAGGLAVDTIGFHNFSSGVTGTDGNITLTAKRADGASTSIGIDGAAAGVQINTKGDNALIIGTDIGSWVFSQDGTDMRADFTGSFKIGSVAFASLPATSFTGDLINITNSNTATWGANITGTGANNVLARWNGSNWTVVGI